ncbi:hypothetical protein SynBIOSU31_02793 [Synechococcus sp. BIOS-U3-1]|nr:hypothetical protein SynBIOSU31_02793 [Synechococcus sp. BIOS-U3-1]
MIRAANESLFIDFPLTFPTIQWRFSTGFGVIWLVWPTSVENLIQEVGFG